MFTVDELLPALKQAWFIEAHGALERNILRARLGLKPEANVQALSSGLGRLSQAVLASAPAWPDPRTGHARHLCVIAADIEAGLSIVRGQLQDVNPHVLKASLLYDIAGMPGAAATMSSRDGLAHEARAYFERLKYSAWGQLGAASDKEPEPADLENRNPDGLMNEAIGEVLSEFGTTLQDSDSKSTRSASSALSMLRDLTKHFGFSCDSDSLNAFFASIRLRRENATLPVVKRMASINENIARTISLPAELWPVQRIALESGLLADQIQSFGIAAPTGTGKTAITRLLLADYFAKHPDRKAIYITPSRALTAQVARDLKESLSLTNRSVAALGAHLTVHEQLSRNVTTADVLVFTPEKADLLMRVDPRTIKSVGLVIVDEAHHIEAGSRGILLEFYLWRLRTVVPSDARIVQLSAVTPNIDELVSWVGSSDSTSAVKVDWRTNRLRIGVFESEQDGTAVVQFPGHQPFRLFERGELPEDEHSGIALLAERLSKTGVVLVLATSIEKAEAIAETIGRNRSALQDAVGVAGERLDARVERELFAESSLRELFRKRVAYHHSQLPPRVRVAVEDVISNKQIDIVCATTTLAEGVNFPFSTVIVESLVGSNYELSPRSLWNIAGRAGRFGVDSEGHCILFRPSLWSTRLREYKLRDYFDTQLDAIPPVRSALASAISDLRQAVEENSIPFDELTKIGLSEIKEMGVASRRAKRIRGLINLMRIGYAHAGRTGVVTFEDDAAPEFEEGLLAAKQLSTADRTFAQRLAVQQRRVLKEALLENDALLAIAARIGWSLETQSELYQWLAGLEDWRLQSFGRMVIGGGVVDEKRLGFLIGPVSKMMSEFEGDKLEGYTSFIAVRWLEGIPLTAIRNAEKGTQDFGRIVRIIYARVQYLLPWALFGVDELLQYEAKRRNIRIEGGVRDLSVLAAEGVPNFDALQLVMQLDLERVDATRLSKAFRSRRRDTDILGWLGSVSWETVAGTVTGSDRRRLDPDLRPTWEAIRGSA